MLQIAAGGTHGNRIIQQSCSYMTSCYVHPIFRKTNLPTTLSTLFTLPAYRTFHIIRITYLTFHNLHITYLHIPTTLFIPFASFTFTYVPHFPHYSLHLPSPIHHTFHTIRIIYIHLYTTLFIRLAPPTFTYLLYLSHHSRYLPSPIYRTILIQIHRRI